MELVNLNQKRVLDVLDGRSGRALECGDSKQLLRLLPANSVDAIVTDPPYELGFMGKGWDKSGIANDPELWAECLRVLKPGGHLLAFSGSRTYHRMACAIEDGGFEVRDQIMWVYGSGFPKSQNISKAIDKQAGAERKVVGKGKGRTGVAAQPNGGSTFSDDGYQWPGEYEITAPATPEAEQWDGWGTALKPAHEPICVARKPLERGLTIAANVLKWGVGAINVDGCRVPHVTVGDGSNLALNSHLRTHINGGNGGHVIAHETERRVVTPAAAGRWPANLIHDDSPEVVALFPESSVTGARTAKSKDAEVAGTSWLTLDHNSTEYTDSGSAARFFYCAKASSSDRHDGCEHPGPQFTHGSTLREVENTAAGGNTHPTVKPTELMRYLVRLVTPPGGVVLDPFMGSGSTGRGARLEGFRFVGFDLSPEYTEISRRRIAAAERIEPAKAKTKRVPAPRTTEAPKTLPAPAVAPADQMSLL